MTGFNGIKKISFYAIDKVGNKSQITNKSDASLIPYLDLTGPDLDYKIIGNKTTIKGNEIISSSTLIELIATDNESGVQNKKYEINGQVFDYKEPFSLEENGINNFKIIAYDNVNNRNEKEISLYLDKVPPKIYYTFDTDAVFNDNSSDTTKTYPSFVKLFLSATDDLVGIEKIEYLMNNVKNTYVKSITGFEKEKEYIIVLMAYDKMGNKTTQILEFKTNNE